MTDDDFKIARIRGVFTANKFDQLLPQHQKIIARITHEVLALGKVEARLEHRIKDSRSNEADRQAAYNASVLGRQPHQAFLIDGPKGAGKSTLLLNLRSTLAQIGPKELNAPLPNTFAVREMEEQFSGHFSDLENYRTLRVGGRLRRLVHALPVIRPDTMEVSESIIECIFAEMTAQLDALESRGRKDGEARDEWSAPNRQSDPKAEAARKLKRELHADVAKGWYFARQLGVEALMNDSMNFDEYIVRRASEAVVSHRRVTRWMDYVNAYLDLFDAEMLAIFLDDTDISSELTSAILHAVRMFFCHPRIVVLMAGNLHIMRQRVLALAMSELSRAHSSLRSGASFTAKFWRDFERDNLEEYLSKVLPRNYRHFIKPSSVDAQHLLAKNSFVTYCGQQMVSRMVEYLKSRKTTRMRDEQDFQLRSARYEQLLDLARQENRFHIEAENHIALWLLRNHYAETLAPQTARQLNQFQEMVRRRPKKKGKNGSPDMLTSSRRVAVTLFTQSNNYGIIQRQDDFDSDAVHWINRQRIQTAWRGPRWIRLNALELPYGTPSYEFILYRLDLEIAKPTTFRQNPNISTTMLPEPSAQKIWAPEIWQTASRDPQRLYLGFDNATPAQEQMQFVEMSNHELRLRQELHGLARAFASPIIPANCIYFKDLRTFPDLAWAWDEKEPDKDPDYLRFFDQFAVRNIDNSFRLDRYDPRNNYFRNVVLVFASYPLLQPIPSEEFVTGSWPLHSLELGDFESLFVETGEQEDSPQGIKADPFVNLRWICVKLSSLYRKALLDNDKPILHPKAELMREIDWVDVVRKLAQGQAGEHNPPPRRLAPGQAQRLISSIVPRYHRMLNDVRRAYHAMRILEQDINNYAYLAHSSGADANTEFRRRQTMSWPPPFVHTRNDRYTLISLDKFRATIGLPAIKPLAQSTPEDPATVSVEDKRYWTPISGAGGQSKNRPVLERPFAAALAEQTSYETQSRTLWIGKFSAERAVPAANDPANWCWRLAFERPDAQDPLDERYLFGERTWRLRGARPDEAIEHASPKFWELVARLPAIAGGQSASADSLHTLGKHLLDTKEPSHAERSRMLRSIFLYLWGIAPSFSSLIHLEIMGRHYWWQEWLDDTRQRLNNPSDPDHAWLGQALTSAERDYLVEIAGRLDDWELSIGHATLATLLLAASLEKNLHEDFQSLDEIGEQDNLATMFAPLPDASITTLGLRLYAADDQVDLEQAFENPRKFSGVFGDALLRLQLAHYYIDELRKSFGDVYRKRVAPADPVPKPAREKSAAKGKRSGRKRA